MADPKWILYELHRHGYSLASLARIHRVSRTSPWRALHHHSPKWEKIIAEAINSTPEQIWPERYDGEQQ